MYVFTGITNQANMLSSPIKMMSFIDPKDNYRIFTSFRNRFFLSYIVGLSNEELVALATKSKLLVPFDVCGTLKNPNSKLFCMKEPNHKGLYCKCYSNTRNFRWLRNDDQLSLFGRKQCLIASFELSLEFSSCYRPKRKIPNNFNPNYWEFETM